MFVVVMLVVFDVPNVFNALDPKHCMRLLTFLMVDNCKIIVPSMHHIPSLSAS